jgi:hypothetical protein
MPLQAKTAILRQDLISRSIMNEIMEALEEIREQVRDNSLSLLSEAVYRGNDDAKKLERQCAKIARAIDKAIYECKNLEKMSSEND